MLRDGNSPDGDSASWLSYSLSRVKYVDFDPDGRDEAFVVVDYRTSDTMLREAVRVRDRLMHPKRAADLVITDAEVRNAMEAFTWVMDQMGHLAAEALLRRSPSADS